MLKNTTVFLTGAAGSLGSATASKLITEGCKVTMLDLPDSKGEDLAKSLGPNALFYPGDVTSDKDVQSALEAATKEFGPLRTVINCAAVHRANNIYNVNKKMAIQKDVVDMVWNVNVWGTLNVIRLAAGFLHQSPVDQSDLRGLVINTSGFGATDGQAGQAVLAGAWGAIESMTLPLCREFGERGIRVMTISPGLMQSNLLHFLSKRVMQTMAVLTPSPKRFGYGEEYANLVVAIMGNNFLNGEVIRLNGGLRLTL